MEVISKKVYTKDLKNNRYLKKLYIKATRFLPLMLISELVLLIEIILCGREMIFMLHGIVNFSMGNMIIYLLIPLFLFVYCIWLLPCLGYSMYVKNMIKKHGESYEIVFDKMGIWINDEFVPWKKGFITLKTNFGIARVAFFKIAYILIYERFSDEERKQIEGWKNA